MRCTLVFIVIVLARAATADVPPTAIPEGPEANSVPAFLGAPAVPRSIPSPRIPQHPFMAPNGRSNIHDDAYMTDAYITAGPLGRTPERRSTFQGAECGSLTFDGAGRIVTVCVGVEGPELVLIDPQTLATEAVMPLPPRSPSPGSSPFSDFSGGGYFYLDQLDRSRGLAAERIGAVRTALATAERATGAGRRTALTTLATQLDRDAASAADAAKVSALAAVVRRIPLVQPR